MGILDLIFPKLCLGCSREGAYICPDCLSKVRLAKPVCPYCERPSIDGSTHTRCAKKNGIDGALAIWEFEGVIRKAILALKYKYSTEVGLELAEIFVHYLQNSKFLIPDSCTLIPIPLYWYRENYRGFNQSNLLGNKIATTCGWKFEPDLLIRKKQTTPQVELSGEARRRNLKGVFALNTSYLIPNTQYLLFDDVATTGSTLTEAAQVLKRAGVKTVWGLTVTR